jgi:hypothetical protein
MSGSSGFYAGLYAKLGCATDTKTDPCTGPSNDGADSFLGFAQSTGTAVPDGGTTVALLGLGMVGLGVVRRRLPR